MRRLFSGLLLAIACGGLSLTCRADDLPRLTAFRPGEVKLDDGLVKARVEACAADILHRLKVDSEFIDPFVLRPETNATARFVGCGMLLDAVVKAAAHGIGGAEMLALKDRMLARIVAAQSVDGRISVFADSSKPGQWDNHEQAYFLQGLCRAWEFFGDRRALAAARCLGDYLIARATPVNIGLETGFILLYRATGEARYLDYLRGRFAIEANMDRYAWLLTHDGHIYHGEPISHVYSWFARALAVKQYRDLAGKASPALDAPMAEGLRRAFSPYSSVSGTITGYCQRQNHTCWGEDWTDSNLGVGHWGETCASAYLMRSLQYMFTESAEPRFGDLYERILYNAFLGALSKDGAKLRYFTPFQQKPAWYWQDTYCCPNNFRREIFEVPDAVFFRAGPRELAVNLLVPATVRTEGASACMRTRYPDDGRASLTVGEGGAGGGFDAVWVRVPLWCRGATVRCGAAVLKPAAGSWARVALKGAKEIEIDFPIVERLVAGQRLQAGKVARLRGPVVYGFDAEGKAVKFADESRTSTYFERGAKDPEPVEDELLALPKEKNADVVCKAPVTTKSLQAAIDRASFGRGGRVIVPAGVWTIGTVWLRSGVELHLLEGAVLKGSANLNDYNAEKAYPQNFGCRNEGWSVKHLIITHESQDVAITGKGVIDGSAEAFMDVPSEKMGRNDFVWRHGYLNAKDRKNCRRPGQVIVFVESKDIRVSGVTLRNMPMWTCFFHGCERVRVDGVTIRSDLRHANTDGFDVDSCRDVVIANCDIETGDDAFAIRGAPDVLRDKTRVCENILVTNCVCRCSASGVRVGVGAGAIRHVRFRDIHIREAGHGILVQSCYPDASYTGVAISDIAFENVTIDESAHAVIVTAGTEKADTVLENVVFRNLKAATSGSVIVEGAGKVRPRDIVFDGLELKLIPPTFPRTKKKDWEVVGVANELKAAIVREKADGVRFERVKISRDPKIGDERRDDYATF